MSAHWEHQRERSTPFMLALLIRLARWFGRAPTRLLLYPIVAYFLLTGGAAREASRQYLRRALGREPTWLDGARHFFAFAACALDRVFFLGEGRRPPVTVLGDPRVREIALSGSGAVLLVSHLGSFEALRINGARDHKVPIRILMDRAHNPMITRMMEALNPELAAGVIDAAQGGPELVLALKQALAAGHVVGIMGDRPRAGERTMTAEFLGGQVELPASPWILAGALGVPVLLGFGIYRGAHGYECYHEVFSERLSLPRATREAALTDCAQRYAARLEHYARLAPYNWFNFYDYWSDEAAADRA